MSADRISAISAAPISQTKMLGISLWFIGLFIGIMGSGLSVRLQRQDR
jgi:hypothetical protein